MPGEEQEPWHELHQLSDSDNIQVIMFPLEHDWTLPETVLSSSVISANS